MRIITVRTLHVYHHENFAYLNPRNTPLVVVGIFKREVYVTKAIVNLTTPAANVIVNYTAKNRVRITINVYNLLTLLIFATF